MTAHDVPATELLQLLYRDHHSWLLGWLKRRVQCRMQAEDHAHDTFLRLLDARDIASIREPRPYLATIARGLVINQLRRAAIEQAYRDMLANRPDQLVPSQEEQALIVETLLEIDALLDALPGKVRKAFLMSQLEGYTYVEIGKRLGVSERMVKKYMAQAMLHYLTAAN